MTRGCGQQANAEYVKGRRALARHDPVAALGLLQKAVDACPPRRRRELARRLYWLAISLQRLGRPAMAVKALDSARRLAPKGPAVRLFRQLTNGYGQPRGACVEHDDYKAFFTIHVQRYLNRVPGQRFASQMEMDAVLEVIAKAWIRLQTEQELGGLDCRGKLGVFQRYRISFPALRADASAEPSRVLAFSRDHSACLDGRSGRLAMPWEHYC